VAWGRSRRWDSRGGMEPDPSSGSSCLTLQRRNEHPGDGGLVNARRNGDALIAGCGESERRLGTSRRSKLASCPAAFQPDPAPRRKYRHGGGVNAGESRAPRAPMGDALRPTSLDVASGVSCTSRRKIFAEVDWSISLQGSWARLS
jgi:hypothetical protein